MDDKSKAAINDNLSALVSLTKWNPVFEAKLGENLFKARSSVILDRIRVRE